MTTDRNETPWYPRRVGLRYVVEARAWSDGFGSCYTFARLDGKVLRFWTLRRAQEAADRLNKGDMPV